MDVTTCLLNIDLTNDCLRHLAAPEADRIIAGTNELVGLFRSTERPIVWVRQEFAPDLSDAFLEMRRRSIQAHVAGTPGAELDPRLDVRATDVMVIKKRYSAFFGTALDEFVRKFSADTDPHWREYVRVHQNHCYRRLPARSGSDLRL